MNRLAVNIVGDELEATASFCAAEGLGIEVTDFAFPDILDSDLTPRINRHLRALEGIAPIIAHGPLFDLVATSTDSAIVEVCHKRHTTALEAVRQIGASIYVAHTNYNPLIMHPTYERLFVKRLLEFWLPYADWAGKHRIVICLENLWEPTPDLQYEIVTTANHPNLKATFDNGHPLVFSDIPSADWIETLGKTVHHCHLHDNNGRIDEHVPVGEGIEDWPALLSAITRHSPQAILVTESDQLDKNRTSIEAIRKLWPVA